MMVINIIRELNGFCSELVKMVTEVAKETKDVDKVWKAVCGAQVVKNHSICTGMVLKKGGDRDITLSYKVPGRESQVFLMVNFKNL